MPNLNKVIPKKRGPKTRLVMPAAFCEMYKSGVPLAGIAEKSGSKISTARLGLIRAGVKLRTIKEAASVSKFDWSAHFKRVAPRTCSNSTKEKLRVSALSRGELFAKGTRINSRGYVEFTRGRHKGRMEHSVIMERLIGRPLNFNEVVHHKDRNRQNNKLSNLQIMTRSEHSKLHRMEGW